jgi:hypothetical protein
LERNNQRQGKDEGKERPILAGNPKDGPSFAFFGLFLLVETGVRPGGSIDFGHVPSGCVG